VESSHCLRSISGLDACIASSGGLTGACTAVAAPVGCVLQLSDGELLMLQQVADIDMDGTISVEVSMCREGEGVLQ
jgi:hypothetical protein